MAGRTCCSSTRRTGRVGRGRASTAALYRNNHDGTFTDVTRGSALDVELYGIGGAAADFDNDGKIDRLPDGARRQPAVPQSRRRKVRRRHQGRRRRRRRIFDERALVRLRHRRQARSVRGELRRLVVEKDLFCTLDGKNKSYCTPESYKGQSPTLYRNRGNGTFEDVTKAAGLLDPASKGLGVAMLDYDGDGRIGSVRRQRHAAEPAVSQHAATARSPTSPLAPASRSAKPGVARAGMGVDAADYDGSGRPSLVIGNFSNEMMALYHNEGTGLFIDEAPRSAIGRTSLLTLTFALFLFRLRSRRPARHLCGQRARRRRHRAACSRACTYAQRPHLFRNTGKGVRGDRPAGRPACSRRSWVAARPMRDYDNDGDLDLFVTANSGPARLFRNDSPTANHVLRVQTIGTTSNRDGIGARVELRSAGGAKPWQIVKTGSSYASQSELPLTFGLGSQTSVNSVRVTWPNGKSEVTGPIKADQTVTLKEGAGVLRTAPIQRGPTRKQEVTAGHLRYSVAACQTDLPNPIDRRADARQHRSHAQHDRLGGRRQRAVPAGAAAWSFRSSRTPRRSSRPSASCCDKLAVPIPNEHTERLAAQGPRARRLHPERLDARGRCKVAGRGVQHDVPDRSRGSALQVPQGESVDSVRGARQPARSAGL